MEPQVRDFELPQFTFLNNKPKKNTYGGKDFQNNTVQKSRGNTARCPSNKPFSHFPNFHPSQRNTSYQSQNPQNKNKFNQKPYHSSNSNDYENNYHSDKYAKGNGSATKANLEKKSYLAYASTADSDNAHVSSELSGFKIVRGANVIHDETEEDFDSPTDFNFIPKSKIVFDKYASSVLTIGPNAKEISLPSFA
jgi:hypothetical protein